MIKIFQQIQFSHLYMMFIWREQVFPFDISCCFFIISQMRKTFSVNIPNIGVLIHNAYSCPKNVHPDPYKRSLFNDVIHNNDAVKIPKSHNCILETLEVFIV